MIVKVPEERVVAEGPPVPSRGEAVTVAPASPTAGSPATTLPRIEAFPEPSKSMPVIVAPAVSVTEREAGEKVSPSFDGITTAAAPVDSTSAE